MNKVKNKMTYLPTNEDRENGPWISQSVPDESKTIEQIFSMYARNEPLGGRLSSTMDAYSDTPQEHVSLDDPDLMELQRMDLTDRFEYLDTLKTNIEYQKQRIKQAQEALLRKQAVEAEVTADLKAYEKELDQSDPKKKEAKKAVKIEKEPAPKTQKDG